jgi:hypothetical protein
MERRRDETVVGRIETVCGRTDTFEGQVGRLHALCSVMCSFRKFARVRVASYTQISRDVFQESRSASDIRFVMHKYMRQNVTDEESADSVATDSESDNK